MVTYSNNQAQQVSEAYNQEGEVDKDERESRDYTTALKQVVSELTEGQRHLSGWRSEQSVRYKLFNNQRKLKNTIGDNTLFNIFQTVLAGLYSDVLGVTALPTDTGDDRIAENLTATFKYDYERMDKDQLDYVWDFQALFHGASLAGLSGMDMETLTPRAEVWDSMATYHDPFAVSPNGDMNRNGAARYIYREKLVTKGDLQRNGNYFNLNSLKYNENVQAEIIQNKQIQAEAVGLGGLQLDKIEGENQLYPIYEGYTTLEEKRCLIAFAQDKKTVLRYSPLREDTMDLPLVIRKIFPMATTWYGVSIPDLTEDKQRALSKLKNLGLDAAIQSILPMYLHADGRLKNPNDLRVFMPRKMIAVKGGNVDNVVAPLNKSTIPQDVPYIMNLITAGAELSTASPDIRQGGRPASGSTATRDALVSRGSDQRYSLAAKIWGWSEKAFWQEVYQMYKELMPEAGVQRKFVRITGGLSISMRNLTKDELVTKNSDPDISIEAVSVANQERLNKLQELRLVLQNVGQLPQANFREGVKEMARLSGFSSEFINKIVPPTIHEIKARFENEELQAGRTVEVSPIDDHPAHLIEHQKLAENPQVKAHILAHNRGQLFNLVNPELSQEGQGQPAPGQEFVQQGQIELPGQQGSVNGSDLSSFSDSTVSSNQLS